MHSGQHHVSSDNPFRGSPRLVSKSKLHNLAPSTPLHPYPWSQLGAHSPGLCLLTPVTLGHPALKPGHRGLYSFLERKKRVRKHPEFHHSRVCIDTQNFFMQQRKACAPLCFNPFSYLSLSSLILFSSKHPFLPIL